jgi:pimeloyl-ACP methyl ester carboxylesterase
MLIKLAKFVLRILPSELAIYVVRLVAAKTQRAHLSPDEEAAMLQSSKMHYGKDKKNVAWVWGQGPLVIFIHGWGGRAAQWAPLALQISKLGFRAVALDVTGHGDSPKWHTGYDYFLHDITDLSRTLDTPVYAYVGHSSGALTMMAARALWGIRAQRYACICAPSFPYPLINVVQKKLNPRPSVLENYKAYITEQFECTWDELQSGWAYANAGSDTLLFYDETDGFVNHSEGDKLLALCPGAELVKTKGYNHQKILAAPELARTLGVFLLKKSKV